MVKRKNKPTSVRFSEDLLEDIDQECEGLGCSRNDFVIEAIEEKLAGKIKEREPKTVKGEIISNDKPTVGTIKTASDGGKYKLMSVNDNGAQVWLQIEEPKEVENIKVVEGGVIEVEL